MNITVFLTAKSKIKNINDINRKIETKYHVKVYIYEEINLKSELKYKHA